MKKYDSIKQKIRNYNINMYENMKNQNLTYRT